MSPAMRKVEMREPNWKELLDAAIVESDQENLAQRIQEARDAIMDKIEDSFQTATSTERQALINAMNAVHELEVASAKARFIPARNAA